MILDDLSSKLATDVSELVVGTNLFLSYLPESPDLCVAIYEMPGGDPKHHMGGGLPAYEEQPIMVLVRYPAGDYAAARNLTEKIRRALGVVSAVINGTNYLRVLGENTPVSLDPDPKQRERMVCNFTVYKEMSVPT